MPTSTLDQPVSTLPFHSGSYANHYVFGLRPGTSDTIRIDAATLFNDNNLVSVSTSSPILGDGVSTPINVVTGFNLIDIDTYFVDDAITNPKISGTFDRSKFTIATDTNSNYVTFGGSNDLDSIIKPLTSTADIGAGVSFVETDNLATTNSVVLRGLKAGTNCNITSTSTEITINSTATANSFGVGTATETTPLVYELDLNTGNVFNLTVTSESQLYFRFINFNSSIRGNLVTINVTTSTLVSLYFENAQFGDNSEFELEPSSNASFIGYVDSVEDGVFMLSQNIDL